MKWKLLLFFSILSLACRRNHDCYVQNSDGVPYDTIACKCYKDVITELEGTPYTVYNSIYITDTITYVIDPITDTNTDSVTYTIDKIEYKVDSTTYASEAYATDTATYKINCD